MIANAYLPSTEHLGQTNHQEKLFPHFQRQLSTWVELYQRYLFCFCFDSENHFQWLANSTFFGQQHPFDPKSYANTISEILSQCLERTLSQNVIWSARLMAWELDHYSRVRHLRSHVPHPCGPSSAPGAATGISAPLRCFGGFGLPFSFYVDC